MLYSEDNGMHIIMYINISFINYYIVPTSQSEVTVVQSDGNQSRHHDESSQVEHTNGLYISTCVYVIFVVYDTLK